MTTSAGGSSDRDYGSPPPPDAVTSVDVIATAVAYPARAASLRVNTHGATAADGRTTTTTMTIPRATVAADETMPARQKRRR